MKSKQQCSRFINDNQLFLNQSIVKQFFQTDPSRWSLLKQALADPTSKANDRINSEFEEFFYYVRLLNYALVCFSHYAKYYDKKRRFIASKYLLTLDQEIAPDITLKDTLVAEDVGNVHSENSHGASIEELVTNHELYHHLLKLSQKQRFVLSEHFINGRSLTEISSQMNSTPQNISNIKRTSIQLLRRHMYKRVGLNEEVRGTFASAT